MRSAAVVGGGIAGLAAATILAERGVAVTLIEREAYLGGRAGSWSETLQNGDRVSMERGFHGFFRQYSNLRRLLRRVDPDLRRLVAAPDYPVLGPNGTSESFRGLPRRAPFNVAALALRTPTLRLRDLPSINPRAALAMLRFRPERDYSRWDDMTAKDYLDSLGFPHQARQMLFDVFAHSFFADESELSAAEMLAMFRYYFVGNRQGLVFDVAAEPMSSAFWQPLGDRIARLGGRVLTETAVDSIERTVGGYSLATGQGAISADAVVLALSVPALIELVRSSPALCQAAPAWTGTLKELPRARPFAVLRLWLDQLAVATRAPFAGTTGLGPLDNISVYDHFQSGSRAWASRRGGSVIELHAYAVSPTADKDDIARQMIDALHRFYPETRSAAVVDKRYLWRADCSGFPPGFADKRPGVQSPLPGLCLAGDFVHTDVPSALMERAAVTGMTAANVLLSGELGRPEPVEPGTGPRRSRWSRRLAGQAGQEVPL